MTSKIIQYSIVYLLVIAMSGCSHLQGKDEQKKDYEIQPTQELEQSFKTFMADYNAQGKGLAGYFPKNFHLQRVRPSTHHIELDNLKEVKKAGIRKALWGDQVKVLGFVIMKPWVGAHLELDVKDKKVRDLTLIHLDGTSVKKIVHIWSAEHHQAEFGIRLKVDDAKQVLKAFRLIEKGYEDNDLKTGFMVIPDFIVFLKMNPIGVRDISMTGQYRKDFLAKNKTENTLWSAKNSKLLIAPPFSLHHTELYKEGKIATERIILRRFEGEKITFTINFVGAEEHRLHVLEDFYKDNPVFNYGYL